MFYISFSSIIYDNIIGNVITVSKGINLKNLILTIMAFLLACCLAFLLFIATNQQALGKVHETISSFSVVDEIAEAKDITKEKSENPINAATEKETHKEPYNAKNYKPIAKLTTHDLKNDEIGKANLPSFSNSLKKAQTLVNKDNNASNAYNDYGIDTTCQGVHYYIFTFENKSKPNTYYRVTVDEYNKASVFDKSYQIKQQNDKPNISPQESEVIAQKYAIDELGENAVLKDVKESKDGMFYTFHEYKTERDYKVVVNKTGDVIRQPALD